MAPWLISIAIAWLVVAVAVGVVLGRSVRAAERSDFTPRAVAPPEQADSLLPVPRVAELGRRRSRHR